MNYETTIVKYYVNFADHVHIVCSSCIAHQLTLWNESADEDDLPFPEIVGDDASYVEGDTAIEAQCDICGLYDPNQESDNE